MKKLRYVKTTDKTQFVDLPIIETYEITKSSQEVSYSDLTCDFINKTVNDLPEKYQEVKIIDADTDKINYFGYIDNYDFNEMRETDIFTEINFTLLSPMKLATLRTFIAVGVYNLDDLIQNTVLKPLINDGFEIATLNVPNKQTTVNFLSQTVEYGMNTLSNQFNLWWFIDENKKIYVQEISEILSSEPMHIYDENHKINGLQYIKPTVSSYNYANVINFSNVRVYEYSYVVFADDEKIYETTPLIKEQVHNLKKGEQLLFKQPIDLKKENILKSGRSFENKDVYIGLSIFGIYTDDTEFGIHANRYNVGTGQWDTSANIGFKGDENANQEFLLIRDSFFSNLIIGFEYNGEKTIDKFYSLESHSALAWEVFKFYNDDAINDKKGIINDTGIVEITVDMNEQWKLMQELQDIGTSFINNNSLKLDGTIELKLDRDIFKIGEILQINNKYFNGKYIVTSIKENFNKVFEYFVTCKNANIINDYIDLFRPSTSEISEDKNYIVNVSHYTQENIKETHEVVQ